MARPDRPELINEMLADYPPSNSGYILPTYILEPNIQTAQKTLEAKRSAIYTN